MTRSEKETGVRGSAEIKCLAVRQPWAWALCVGAKDIENRSWTTKYRGTIAIIASAKETMVNGIVRQAKPRKLSTDQFAFSAVIGFVDLVGIEPLNQDLEKNPWAWGPYCWRVAKPRLLQSPIPCKAKLNLYDAEAELAAKIEAQRDRAIATLLGEMEKEWIELSKDLDQPRTWGHIVSYEAVEDWVNMERLAKFGLKTDAGDFGLLHALALSSGEQGKNSEALAASERMVRADPDSAVAYFLRGTAYHNLGDDVKSASDLKRAHEIDPEFEAGVQGSDSGEE